MFSCAELKGRLIVSCQALPDEPLYGAPIMGRMALAAKEGGAAAIRAQGTADIRAIRELAGLPVFGLIKRSYADSDIYITPTSGESSRFLEGMRQRSLYEARPGSMTSPSFHDCPSSRL